VQIKCTAEWRPWPHPPIHPQMPMHPEINQQIDHSLAQPWKSTDFLIPQSSQAVQKQIQNTQKRSLRLVGGTKQTLVVILLSSQS
jgi:hypothetical protein